ncbi:gamma-glutamylcyclotransferase-like [Argiope bruennichi]|uniref:gamma-glutamylcyclotransferase-like n=1 Tax=Argiope bruennichi TaxID=94029 RepID=UPI0024954762|nr:gamma-glutamylcyclotransferase-like [Argiope bruennichi]XP_055943610.1 gamma-glutamylcyclotransferase-like [Argiope bruennichi]XP_055943611.1 gamma-glutamylcyclotransferase-like [Argiope bruennichi]
MYEYKRMHLPCHLLISSELRRSWKGSTAAIIESENDFVWGVIWEISKDQEEVLDKHEKGYIPLILPIEIDSFRRLDCKVYLRFVKEEEVGKPSCLYKAVFIQGAKEHRLPLHYIQKLEAVEDNGYKGPVDIPVKVDICS